MPIVLPLLWLPVVAFCADSKAYVMSAGDYLTAPGAITPFHPGKGLLGGAFSVPPGIPLTRRRNDGHDQLPGILERMSNHMELSSPNWSAGKRNRLERLAAEKPPE